MSAHDYYQPASQPTQQYQAYNPSTASPPREDNYNQHGSAPQSLYYHDVSFDQRPPQTNQAPNTFTEDIPMKDHSRIHTNQSEWPTTQHTAYPPSPESQIPNPALLPPPARSKSKRKKKKGGFFSGKVPWFVYIMTLIQVTVFLVEIVKNCAYDPLQELSISDTLQQ